MNLFRRKQTQRQSTVGKQAELIHDITSCQYGSVVIDNVRYSVKSVTGESMLRGTMIEVLEEASPHGTIILTVKKI